MPTVEKNSYVHWLGSCISFRSTSSKWLKKHKDSWLQHCEFWCHKTACFRGMFLHPPQWKKRARSHDANTNMNCFSGSQFPMNHQSHSLSEIQIWTWPEHLPITALRCCHSPSSGMNNTNNWRQRKKVNLQTSKDVGCASMTGWPFLVPFPFCAACSAFQRRQALTSASTAISHVKSQWKYCCDIRLLLARKSASYLKRSQMGHSV